MSNLAAASAIGLPLRHAPSPHDDRFAHHERRRLAVGLVDELGIVLEEREKALPENARALAGRLDATL
jgi:hypothetical protein